MSKCKLNIYNINLVIGTLGQRSYDIWQLLYICKKYLDTLYMGVLYILRISACPTKMVGHQVGLSNFLMITMSCPTWHTWPTFSAIINKKNKNNKINKYQYTSLEKNISLYYNKGRTGRVGRASIFIYWGICLAYLVAYLFGRPGVKNND